MKAAIYVGADQPLQVEDVPDPQAAPDEVVVEIAYSGVCMSDIHLLEAATSRPVSFLVPGTVLGHEFAGRVVEVGIDVSTLRVGDAVSAHAIVGCGHCHSCESGMPWWCRLRASQRGGYAQFASVSARACELLGPDVPLTLGALVEPTASSLHAVRMIPDSAETVLVLGSGPIGLAAVYWAKTRGVNMVTAVGRTSARADLAVKMGADAFIPRGMRSPAELVAGMSAAPSVVIECAGVPGALNDAMSIVAPRGLVVAAGACQKPDEIDHVLGTMKELVIRYSAAYDAGEFKEVAAGMATGHALGDLVSATLSWSQFPSAVEDLRNGRRSGKVLLAPRS